MIKKLRRFDPLWKRPYKFVKRIFETMWKPKRFSSRTGYGRQPINIFHEDQIQPFDLPG